MAAERSAEGRAAQARKRAPGARFFERVRAYLRLGAYVTFVLVVLGALALRSAYASAKESSMIVGRDLAKLADVLGSTKELTLNGQRVFVSTTGTDQTVPQVLDRFEQHCMEHASAMAEEFQKLDETLKEKVTQGVPSRGFGVARNEVGDEEGMISCFANDEPGGATAVMARFREFQRTGDLGAFGRLRYVYATKTKRGGTHVVTVWTEGSFNLREMFPAQGDANGVDSPIVPRPASSRRLLTAHIAGEAYGVWMYETTLTQKAYFDQLTTAMQAKGWQRIVAPSGGDSSVGFVHGGGAEILVSAAPESDRTQITILQMGREGGDETQVVPLP